MSAQTIAVIANIALSLSVVVAIIFGLVQIKVAKRDRRERLTVETLQAFHSKEFAELFLFTTNEQIPQTYAGWESLPKESKLLFIQLTQQMESLGISLADGLINFNLVDKTLGSFVAHTWERFKPLLMSMRAEVADPFLSEYFQWMAEQIEKRMKAAVRKPFFEKRKGR